MKIRGLPQWHFWRGFHAKSVRLSGTKKHFQINSSRLWRRGTNENANELLRQFPDGDRRRLPAVSRDSLLPNGARFHVPTDVAPHNPPVLTQAWQAAPDSVTMMIHGSLGGPTTGGSDGQVSRALQGAQFGHR